MTNIVVLENADRVMKILDGLRPENPKMKTELRKMMRKVLSGARQSVKKEAKRNIKKDPRNAACAVRHSVYKRVLGGQVNILSPRKVTKMAIYRKKTKLRAGQVGGNRWERSDATKRMDAYVGKDRGFVLRWTDKGTKARHIDVHKNKVWKTLRKIGVRKKGSNGKYGHRGAIEAKNWFAPSARKALQDAQGQFMNMVNDAIITQWRR